MVEQTDHNAHSKVLIMPIVSILEWALLDAYDGHSNKKPPGIPLDGFSYGNRIGEITLSFL